MIVAPVADAAALLPPILPPDPAEATTLEPASVVELARDASVVLLIFPVSVSYTHLTLPTKLEV